MAIAATGCRYFNYATTETFVASGPFAPSRGSYETFAPSGSDLKLRPDPL